MDFLIATLGGIATGVAATVLVCSGREDKLRKRIRMEANRADTWRSNFCYLQARMNDEAAAERRAAVDAAEAIVNRQAAA